MALDYERLDPEKLALAIRRVSGERLLVRQGFRWHIDGVVVSNGYESFSMQSICDDNGWKTVETYGAHIAIVTADEIKPSA